MYPSHDKPRISTGESTLPALSRICPLDQGALHFQVQGVGPPVLLIMGFMARGHGWRSQIEALRSDYQVAWFDHRGVGESPGPAARSMNAFAQDCLALFNKLGWKSAHILGVSMGGMIAQELALLAPERVRSLTLIVTQPGGVLSAIPPRRGFPIFIRAQLARSPEMRIEALKSLLIPESARALISEEELAGKLREDFTPKPPLATRLSHVWAILRHRTQHRLLSLKQPTLIIQAREDLLVHPRHSERIATWIPHARLVSIEDAGHGVIRQRGTRLNSEIRDHLNQVEEHQERSGG